MPKPEFPLTEGDAPDTPFDISLRPPMFSEFAGQQKTVERLQLMVEAAQQRGEALNTSCSAARRGWARPPWPTSSPTPWA